MHAELAFLSENISVLQGCWNRAGQLLWEIKLACDGKTTNKAGVPGFVPVCH